MTSTVTQEAPGTEVGPPTAGRLSRTVAWVIRADESYGVLRCTASVLQGLKARGWDTPIAAIGNGGAAEFCRREGYAVYCLDVDLPPRPVGGCWRKAMHYLAHLRAVRGISRSITAWLKELRPDAVHVQWPDLVTVAGRVASSLRVPCFWHLPTVIREERWLGVSLPALFYQWQCKRHGVVPLGCTRSTAATLGEMWVKAEVVYSAVDDQRFNPDHVRQMSREELGIPQDAIVLGMCARLIQEKGQDRVLRAMLSLADTEPPLHLLLAGGPTDTPYSDRLRAIAAEHHAEDRLHMLGCIDDPERCYGAIDVAVHAFLGEEGFCNSVVEAMMMAKPVLAHASGGPAEFVMNGVTGWHVPEPTVPAFARGLQRALAACDQWPQMGARARSYAVQNFSIEAFTQRYTAIVERTLAGQAGRQ